MARKIILTLQPNLLAACLGLLVAARGVEAKYVVRTLEANLRVRLAPSLPRAQGSLHSRSAQLAAAVPA